MGRRRFMQQQFCRPNIKKYIKKVCKLNSKEIKDFFFVRFEIYLTLLEQITLTTF